MGEWAVRVGEPSKRSNSINFQAITRLYVAVSFRLGGMSCVTARC